MSRARHAVKRFTPGFRSYVSCKFYKHIKGMYGFCFGDKEGVDFVEI